MRDLGALAGMVGKLFADYAGVKWPVALGAAALGYFLPTEAQQQAAIGAAHLIAVDTVTGVVASRMTGKPITSAKLGRALVKLLAYCSVLSVVAVAGTHIPGASTAQGVSVTAVLSLIIMTEGISVLENVKTMGVTLPFGIDSWLAGRLPQQKPEEPKP